jgi:hypothetical protein
VCKAKCCRIGAGKRCPKLGKDSRCTIYETRFAPGQPDLVRIGFVKWKGKKKPVECARIETILDKLPRSITDGCVYAHPELLDPYKFERENTPNEDDD